MNILTPKKKNFEGITGKITTGYGMAKCMAQCTGCQCNKNTFSTDSVFDEVIAPAEQMFGMILGKISPEQEFSAARCNCTSCNSCRCDCSCRFFPTSTEEIW